MIKLSKTSKMPGASWSLPAIKTCPGAFQKNATTGERELVPVCAGCYAAEGFYRMKGATAVRDNNLQDWQRDDWTADMIAVMDNHRYFRWFDSGDCYKLALAEKILKVMIATPWVKHWMPTRMHKFAPFAAVFERMNALPNVIVRPSGDDLNIEHWNQYGSFVTTTEDVPEGVTLCEAFKREGKCGPCRACWSKDVATVAYLAHGQSMKKVVRIALAQ